MHPVFRLSAAVLVGAMLTACGAEAIVPAATRGTAVQASALKTYAAETAANAADVEKLIADFKAVTGVDEVAMTKRAAIIAKLGDSDDDKALTFLQSEYENLGAVPETVREGLEEKIMDAIDALDTYEEESDDAIIAAGRGEDGSMQAAYYDYAYARRKRRGGLLHWLGSPFRWVGRGLGKIWDGIRGKKKRRRRRRTPPGYPPSYPSDPGYGNGNGNGYSQPYYPPSRRY